MKFKIIKTAHSQTGSSLVETMVSLFVLAIGLLGTLAMQTKSVQHNQNSYSFSQALVLASDLSERLRTAENVQNVVKDWQDNAVKNALPSGTAEIKDGENATEVQSIALEFFGGTSKDGNKHKLTLATWTTDDVSK